MPERWYRAASYPNLQAAGEAYQDIEQLVTVELAGMDVGGYRFVTDGQARVIVFGYKPCALDAATVERLECMLAQLGGTPEADVADGVLDAIFEHWEKSLRGPGPPVVKHGMWDVREYER